MKFYNDPEDVNPSELHEYEILDWNWTDEDFENEEDKWDDFYDSSFDGEE